MEFDRRALTDDQLLDLYRALLLPRMIEEKMLILLRQGRISKWFSGIGQEAIAVGVTAALRKTDYILPLHRNLGVFVGRDLPLRRLVAQWQGKADGYTRGRDRSFHFGAPEQRVVGMISHLGAMLPVADGLALAAQLDQRDDIAVAFSGDGGTSEGDFHEALNVASVWELPVLFLVENNGYGLSTPSEQQFRAKNLSDRATGYGMEGLSINGNNLLEVFHTISDLAQSQRVNPRPILLECRTYRMRGHEEASGTKYIPDAFFEEGARHDPVENYELFLKSKGLLDDNRIATIRREHKAYIDEEVEAGFAMAEPDAKGTTEEQSVYAAFDTKLTPPPTSDRSLRFVDAVREGLWQAMERDSKLVIMGQDVAEYGGVFKVTDGFVEAFGVDRVRNTPICESAILGAALGLSLAGRKSVVEMQFADFVSCGYNQIVNNLAKNHYRWGHPADLVVRMPTGAGVAAGPYHSQSTESWFTQIPGLKVVYPATAADAKGLLTTSILDPNPVLFFEHKLLYRSESGPVAEAYYNLPLGQAAVVTPGDTLTIVTYGLGVRWATELAKAQAGDIEVIDLRSLLPWDRATVFASVRKTGKCLVLYEATRTGSFGAEIAAEIGEHCFESLDGPVRRLASLDTPVPFHAELEREFLPERRLADAVDALLQW